MIDNYNIILKDAIITDILQEMNYIILLRIIEFSPFTGTTDIQHWTISYSQDCNRIKFKSTSRRKAVIISPRFLAAIRNRTVFYRYLFSFHHIINRQISEISSVIFEILDPSSIQYRLEISSQFVFRIFGREFSDIAIKWPAIFSFNMMWRCTDNGFDVIDIG